MQLMMSNINAIRLLGLLLLLLGMSGCVSDAPPSSTASDSDLEASAAEDNDGRNRITMDSSGYVHPLPGFSIEWKKTLIQDCYKQGDYWTLIRPRLRHYLEFKIEGGEYNNLHDKLFRNRLTYDREIRIDVDCIIVLPNQGLITIDCNYYAEKVDYFKRDFMDEQLGYISMFKCDTTKYRQFNAYSYISLTLKPSASDPSSKQLRAYKSTDYELINNSKAYNLQDPVGSFRTLVQLEQAKDEELLTMINVQKGVGIGLGGNEGLSYCDAYDSDEPPQHFRSYYFIR